MVMVMISRTLLLGAVATLALGTAASAYERNGWYVGLEGGWNWIDDADVGLSVDVDPPGGPVLSTGEIEFEDGWVALGTLGYAFANRFRAELEVGYRENDTLVANELSQWTAMVNVLYDIPLGRWATFSIGAGAGGDYANWHLTGTTFDERELNFAYQGIAGLNFRVGPRLDLTLNYRYLTVLEPEFTGRVTGPASTLGFAFDDVVNHTATIGLRYSFGQREEAAPPPPPPPPPPPEPVKAPKEFIVFFGHNKSNLTPEAMDVVRQAAVAAKEYGSASITVVGHADRSGSPKYNEALSMRRAGAVKGALVSEGIADGSISTSAKGESDPMVQTDDGVREPQNRRVHISL